MNSEKSKQSRVHIAAQSLVADWLSTRAMNFGTPLAAIQRNTRAEHIFLENELLVDANDRSTLSYLSERHDAEIVPLPPVPPQPRGMDPSRARSVDKMPMPVLVRFKGETVPLEPLNAVAEQHPEGILRVTSRAGAGTLALAALLVRDGRKALLNSVGASCVLPITQSTEGPGPNNDAYQWPEYAGPSNIAKAWQLMQAYSLAGGDHHPTFLGIFDAGFSLNDDGTPWAPPGQSPDVTNFIQHNLVADFPYPGFTESPSIAAGSNDEPAKPWHGSAMLSVAAAPVNNNAGVAGAGGIASMDGGQIVIPCLLKTLRSVRQILWGVKLCVAWGVDVGSMSFSLEYPVWYFPSSIWEETFQFAADQGMVIIASAGNDAAELPDKVIYPATRTPGVITVGAIDTPSGNLPRNDSNFGSSVDIWAPGTNIHIMPDKSTQATSLASGTSVAAPMVAGIAALMKSINPTLTAGDVKRILLETGHTDSPDQKVTVSLDALAALLRVMGDKLPADQQEPNNTRETARPIFPGPGGILAPVGPTTIGSDESDWYSFQVGEFSSLSVNVDFLPGLSYLTVELVSDDPESRAPSETNYFYQGGRTNITVAVIAPGGYRLAVKGNRPNLYELRVQLSSSPLLPDQFENNNTREHPAAFTFQKGATPGLRFDQRFRPGTYDANLHVAGDPDFYSIEDIKEFIFAESVFRIEGTDAPVDAVLFGADGKQIDQVQGVRKLRFVLPGSNCLVRVTGAQQTRYLLTVHTELKKGITLPGPLQEEVVVPVPHYTPDPPFVMQEWEKFLQIQVTDELKQVGSLRLTGAMGLTMELLADNGTTLVAGQNVEKGASSALEMNLSSVPTGTYILRVGRDLPASSRLDPTLGARVAHFHLGPGW
jgi:hypothetical protein